MRRSRHAIVSLVTLALLGALLAPAPARAEPLVRIANGFTPHPYVSEVIKVKMDRVYMSDAGFSKCGNYFTTKEPAFTFELTEKFTDLNLYFTTPSVVVVFPNGAYACSNQGNFLFPEWPAGTYKVFYHSSAIGASSPVRIEQPQRIKREVFEAFGKTPQIVFDESATTNPQFVELPPTPGAMARELEFGCAKTGTTTVRPLARIEVKTQGLYRLVVPGAPLMVASPTGCVQEESYRRNNTMYNTQYSLAPGSYSLWTHVEEEPRTLTLQAGDDQRPLLFGEAEVKELGGLAEPMLISGTTRPGERWPSRRNACTGRSVARAPDFYFQTTEPLPQVELSLFRNREKVAFRLYGPMDSVKPYSQMICDETRRTFGTLDGKYAVWLAAAPKAEASSYDLLVMRKDLKVDPMQTLKPIPETLETIGERVVSDHYPFFGRMSHAYLFPKAPDRLFVYAAAAFPSGEQKVLAGEPLLVLGDRNGKLQLARYDGAEVQATPDQLVVEKPAKLALPRKPAFQPAKDYDGAWKLVGPPDQKIVDRMNAVANKYHACVGSWMRKNDPTWGKDYELVYVSGRHAGKTMSDRKFEQAAVVCGEAKVIAAEKNFVKQINLAAKSRAARHLQQVRKRFAIRP
ncbi:MAG: hypothetical protein P1V51_16885 [Deltaproteobacteria bacterium]|nr:hypothetical protein [Deltaproteobacteria bacterium]